MTRIMEIFVVVNAACGIAAFLIAKGLINKARRKARDMLRDEPAEIEKGGHSGQATDSRL